MEENAAVLANLQQLVTIRDAEALTIGSRVQKEETAIRLGAANANLNELET
jgi:hypothetical protein